jgi:hypothetical protein
MKDKTLRITFSGISTLWPGPPRNNEEPPVKAFVLMAASGAVQANRWGATVPDHFPFVHVASSLLVNPPNPNETVIVAAGGERLVYFFQDARVVIDPPPRYGTGIKYFIEPLPLDERPGSNDVASTRDIRWLADIRDILPQRTPPTLTVDPAAASVGEEVAAVIDLEGGTLQANFPGDTVNAKVFRDAKGNVILKRVMACEFIVDIPYPEETDHVTLWFHQLRTDTPVSGPSNLVLKWPEGETTISLRMGNDPKSEVRLLDTPERFDPLRLTGPVLKPRDDDFDLHYKLLDVPQEERLLPQVDIHQCHADGCLPLG